MTQVSGGIRTSLANWHCGQVITASNSIFCMENFFILAFPDLISPDPTVFLRQVSVIIRQYPRKAMRASIKEISPIRKCVPM